MYLYHAIICKSFTYCTNCPIRVNCDTRESFYDDVKFQKNNAFAGTTTISTFSAMGVPEELIASGLSRAKEKLNQKRQRELEEHPTYSKQ